METRERRGGRTTVLDQMVRLAPEQVSRLAIARLTAGEASSVIANRGSFFEHDSKDSQTALLLPLLAQSRRGYYAPLEGLVDSTGDGTGNRRGAGVGVVDLRVVAVVGRRGSEGGSGVMSLGVGSFCVRIGVMGRRARRLGSGESPSRRRVSRLLLLDERRSRCDRVARFVRVGASLERGDGVGGLTSRVTVGIVLTVEWATLVAVTADAVTGGPAMTAPWTYTIMSAVCEFESHQLLSRFDPATTYEGNDRLSLAVLTEDVLFDPSTERSDDS